MATKLDELIAMLSGGAVTHGPADSASATALANTASTGGATAPATGSAPAPGLAAPGVEQAADQAATNGAWQGPGLTARTSALQQLLAGLQKHQAAGGHQGGPFGLAASTDAAAGASALAPKLVEDPGMQGLNAIAQLTSHGPRAGQAHLEYDLPNGMRANVYYDEKGRQQVFRFKPSATPGM